MADVLHKAVAIVRYHYLVPGRYFECLSGHLREGNIKMQSDQLDTSATSVTVIQLRQPEPTVEPSYPQPDLVKLVAELKAGADAALEQFYKLFGKGLRHYLCRHLGAQDLDDKVHDTFLMVVKAIQRGDLREPERLMGFVRTVVHRKVAACIEQSVLSRRNEGDFAAAGNTVADSTKNPEQAVMSRQKTELVQKSLNQLSQRDREILIRFYLQEQPLEQICREMVLTETQFRVIKSRAKSKFGVIGKKVLIPAGLIHRLQTGSQHE